MTRAVLEVPLGRMAHYLRHLGQTNRSARTARGQLQRDLSLSSIKAIFLSYASQDADEARRISDALRAAGL